MARRRMAPTRRDLDGSGPGESPGIVETLRMTQNIYDNPEFFAGYSRLGRSIDGLDGAAEWPVMRAMLPDLRDRTVVDLGCGFGWFCRWARQHGAAQVLGLDVSENMLARARSETVDPAVRYARADWNGSICRWARSTSLTVRWRCITS